MAIYRVINKPGDFRTEQDVERGVGYVISPKAAKQDGVFGGAVPLSCAADAMNCVSDVYHNKKGVRFRHSVLSFARDDGISTDEAKEIAEKCISFYSDEYQIVAGVHEDTQYTHIHFGMNTTSYVDGSRYPGTKSDYYNFLEYLNQVVKPYGIIVKAVKSQESVEL